MDDDRAASKELRDLRVPHWEASAPTLPAISPEMLFNGYVGVHVVLAMHELGVWSALEECAYSVSDLAKKVGAREEKLRALLNAASLLGYATQHPHSVALTESGRSLLRQMGFFVWGASGYGSLLNNLSELTKGSLRYGEDVPRNEASIAAGAGEVGRNLMQPIQTRVLSGIEFTTIADIGCGDGTRLVQLCRQDDRRRGLGIDISTSACALARQKVDAAGMSERITIECENILRSLNSRIFPGVDLVACFLMMHDLFNATDDHPGVIRSIRKAFPDARYLLVADTTTQEWATQGESLPIFSLEFELVHAMMDVSLRHKSSYVAAFEAAGLRVVRCESLGVPSTWLFLMEVTH